MEKRIFQLCIVLQVVAFVNSVNVIDLFAERQNLNYVRTGNPENFIKSQRACVRLGGRLAIIKNAQEATLARKHVTNEDFFVGITDLRKEGKMRWTNGDLFNSTHAQLLKFEKGEPDNNYNEDCYSLSLRGLKDVPCSKEFKLKALCQILPNVYGSRNQLFGVVFDKPLIGALTVDFENNGVKVRGMVQPKADNQTIILSLLYNETLKTHEKFCEGKMTMSRMLTLFKGKLDLKEPSEGSPKDRFVADTFIENVKDKTAQKYAIVITTTDNEYQPIACHGIRKFREVHFFAEVAYTEFMSATGVKKEELFPA